MPGGGVPTAAPAQPGQAAPAAQPPVRSARDILNARMQQAGGTLQQPQPAGALPKTGIPGQAVPVPPGGAPPAAPAAAPAQPGTQGTGGIVDPQGSVQGAPQGNGTPWSNMNQYDSLFVKYGNMYGVDPNALKAVMAVESGGVVPANGHGLMQVQGNWQGTGGYDINTNEGQIAVAAMILGGQVQGGQPGNLEANFRNLYFNAPVDSSGNGTTQDAYWNWIQSNLQGGGAAPAGGPLDKSSVPGAANSSTPNPTPTPTDNQEAPTGTTPGVNQSGSWNEANAMQEAIAQIGKSYGGIPDPSDPNPSSFDCSGLTRYISQRNGAPYVPMGSEAQMQVAQDQGILRSGLNGVQPGDMVFFDTGYRDGGYCQAGHPGPSTCGPCLNCASHVGFYVGPTRDCPGGAILGAQTDGVGYMCTSAYPVLGNATPGQYQAQNQYGL